YFVFQVPGQNQDVIRLGLPDPFGGGNGNVCARKKLAVFVRIAIYGVIQKVGPDTAIVQQGVAFPRSTVSSNRFAFSLRLNQKLQKLSLGFLDLFREGKIRRQLSEAGVFLALRQFASPAGRRSFWVLSMACIDPQGATVSSQFLDVK